MMRAKGRAARARAAFAFGVPIGALAGLIGLGGGEFPASGPGRHPRIHAARGTAALIISLLMVCVGLWRCQGFGALPDADALVATALPMGMGSILGAVVEGILAGVFPALVLKLTLGFILIAVALGTFGRRQECAPRGTMLVAEETNAGTLGT